MFEFDRRVTESGIATEQPKHWFWSVIKKSWPIYSEVLIASFLINLFAVILPLFIMNVYDRVVPNHALTTLWVLAIGVAVVFIFDFVMRTLRGYFIDIASKQVDIELSASVFEQILNVRMAQRPKSVGAMANMVHAFESFREFITSVSITVLIDVPFTLLFVAIMLLIGGWPIAIVPLIAMPLAVGFGCLIQKPLNNMVKENYHYSTQKQATLIETLNNIEVVKSIGAESTLQGRWEQVSKVAAKLGVKLRFLSNMGINFSIFTQQFSSIIVVVVGVYLIAAGELTVGGLIACTILAGRALAPMSQVAGLLTRYQQSVNAIAAVDHLMKMPVEREKNHRPLHRPNLKGAIEFREVGFSYPEQATPALTGISFKIAAGEHVGILGRMGAGKTSLEKLILGLYQPTAGNILIDGVEMQQIDLAQLRRSIGYVPQDVSLFYGSILSNIVFHAPYVDDSLILQAAMLSNVNQFTNNHPQGLDAEIGEKGSHLSGGQRQSVAVARAMLLNPPILIMDEPTNAMDDKTALQLRQNLHSFINNKTLLLVTHQGSMLSLVDRLLVIDHGKLIADGPKDQVLQALKEGKIKA